MNKEKRTRVALVLDQSGSMASVRSEAIEGFNRALDQIRETAESGGETTVSLFVFNQHVEHRFMNASVQDIVSLNDRSYFPKGLTALRDAVGQAIETIEEVDSLEGDAAALVVVVTDGYENSSSKWNQADLAEKIQQLEDTGKWTFTFMCANIDPKRVEQEFNVPQHNVAMFVSDSHGTRSMGDTVGNSLGTYMTSREKGVTAVSDFYKIEKDKTAS
jgi:uncharacterized protein YegL